MPTENPRIDEIAHEAAAMPDGASRDAYLDAACGADAELRTRVVAILGGGAPRSPVLDMSSEDLPATCAYLPSAGRAGAAIGPYKLLQPIGEGGMGSVFMAEQTEPVRRQVAVKIIKPGMDSQQVIARFEAERQALALMDHPNIARVLDAGTTATGQPYFVMELVRGLPITQYCDQHRVPLRSRLELMIPICQAVQHAHQKGIIHRDLKPSNVMIALYDGQPVPKVIDFGVAKATGPRLTERTMFTEYGAIIGTLEYMSPEQAELNHLDVDTRSDIYSLGVLLYELITGTTPLDRTWLKKSAMHEVLRVIREDEPPKPSTRLSGSGDLPSIAANRGLESGRMPGQIRGELDWIVMKALEKDRNRRYETATGLLRDIQRYLADEPVQACPPSVAYRVRKLTRRYKVALAATALVGAALVLGLAASLWQATLARRAERVAQTLLVAEQKAHSRASRAEELADSRLQAEQTARQQSLDEAAKAKTVSNLLQRMLYLANPDAAKGVEYTVRQLLDDFSEELAGQLEDQPDAAASIRATIGNAYRRMDVLDKAEPHLKAALELRERYFGPVHAEVAQSRYDYAFYLLALNDSRRTEAEKQIREALAIHQSLRIENSATVEYYALLQLVLSNMHRFQEADTVAREGLAVARRLPQQPSVVADILHRLAGSMIRQNDAVRAEPLAREAVELHRQLHGNGHPELAWGLFTLGGALHAQQKLDEAQRCYREALAIFRKQYYDTHVGVRMTRTALQNLLQAQGDQAGIAELRQDHIALLKDMLIRNPDDRGTQISGAVALLEAGEAGEAESVGTRLVAARPDMASGWGLRGQARSQRGDTAAAVEDFTRALDLEPNNQEFIKARMIAYHALGLHEKAVADAFRLAGVSVAERTASQNAGALLPSLSTIFGQSNRQPAILPATSQAEESQAEPTLRESER